MSARSRPSWVVIGVVALALAACGSSGSHLTTVSPSDCHPQQIVVTPTHALNSPAVSYPPTLVDLQTMVRAEVIAAIPCKYSNAAVSPDQQTLILYAAPLDDEAKAAIATAASHYPSVAVLAEDGAQPEVVAELQRERLGVPPKGVSSMATGIGADGRLEIEAFVDSKATADKLRRAILLAVADKSDLEKQLPAAEPKIEIDFPDDEPQSVRLTIAMSPPCQNIPGVHVNGGYWETDDATPGSWGAEIDGTFTIESDGTATFVGDDGERVRFHRTGFSSMRCSVN